MFVFKLLHTKLPSQSLIECSWTPNSDFEGILYRDGLEKYIFRSKMHVLS